MNYELGFLYVFVSSSDNIYLKKIKIQLLILKGYYLLYRMLKIISEETTPILHNDMSFSSRGNKTIGFEVMVYVDNSFNSEVV